MPTRKIVETNRCDEQRCRHPEHNPPTMQVFEPGLYEHECPSCHEKLRFRVNQPSWNSVVQPRAAIQQVAPRPAWVDDEPDIDSNPLHNIGYGRGDETAEKIMQWRHKQG